MTPSVCPSCGTPAAAGAQFCSRCGRTLTSAGPTPPLTPSSPYQMPSGAPAPVPPPSPYSPSYPPGYPQGGYAWQAPGPAPPWMTGSSRATPHEDGPALRDAVLAGVLLLIGFGIGYVAPAALGTTILPATSTSAVSISSATLWQLAAISVASAACVAIGLALLHRAFRGIQHPEFRTPATLSIMGVIGLLLLVFVDLALIDTLSQLLNCLGGTSTAANSTLTLNCISGGSFLLELAGVLIFGLLTIIGYIGTAVGIYRLGRRNGDTILEVAAVLICLPYLNIIAALLLIAGAHGARGRLGTPRSMGYAGLP